MQAFDYVAPKSAEEVVALLAGKNGDVRILAGGTALTRKHSMLTTPGTSKFSLRVSAGWRCAASTTAPIMI